MYLRPGSSCSWPAAMLLLQHDIHMSNEKIPFFSYISNRDNYYCTVSAGSSTTHDPITHRSLQQSSCLYSALCSIRVTLKSKYIILFLNLFILFGVLISNTFHFQTLSHCLQYYALHSRSPSSTSHKPIDFLLWSTRPFSSRVTQKPLYYFNTHYWSINEYQQVLQ